MRFSRHISKSNQLCERKNSMMPDSGIEDWTCAMKKTKKVISSLLAAAMVLAFLTPVESTAAETSNKMRLWYDEPASSTASGLDTNGIWQSATLPIGNGKLGANIYGEVQKEHLTLNEETLWSGGKYSSSTPGGNVEISDATWNSMVSTILDGKTVDATKLQGVKDDKSNGYYNGYQALGDLYFTFNSGSSSASSNYVRQLDLEEGLASVSDTGYTRTYFASNPDNVIVAHLTGDSLNFTVSMASQQGGTISASVSGAAAYAMDEAEDAAPADETTPAEEPAADTPAADEDTLPAEEPAAQPAETAVPQTLDTADEPVITDEPVVADEPAIDEPEDNAPAASEDAAPVDDTPTEEDPAAEPAAQSATGSGSIGYITCKGTVSNNGLMHNTQIAVVPTDGTVSVSGSGIKVTGATEVTIYITAATDYAKDFTDSSGSTEYYYRTGEDADALNARVKKVLDAAVDKGYAEVLAAHQNDYKALYNTVSVDLGGSSDKTTDALLNGYSSASTAEKRYLETLQYQYGRYLLISGSRENSQLPTTLQGIWNNNNTAPWFSDIHTNINLQMNYWLAGTSNLTSCLKPLCEYMNAMYEPGNRTVKAYTTADVGMMMHTQNTPFGYTCPGWSYSWGWSPSASTWLLQNCYDYYQYTGDKTYLEETLYPLMEKQVAMYEQLLVNKGGKLVFPLSISPEIGGLTYGNTYEQSLIWQLYTDTIEAAKVLGKDTTAMEKTRSNLYTSFIGKTTSTIGNVASGSQYIKEWYDETNYENSYNSSDTGHRHISQMLGIFPGSMLGSISGNYETDRTAAVNTLKLRGKNTVSGWSLAQRACTWAALGDGANAYDYLSTVLTKGVMKNLWGYHEYGSYGGDGKAFQIDANYGYSAAFGEMLLQSNMGYIDVLPAIPDAWSSGSFDGLLAEGGFAVSAKWADSKLTSLSITSRNGGACAVKLDAENVSVTCNGQKVAVTAKDGVFTFDTTAGNTYVITEAAAAPALNVTTSRNADGNVTLTWNAQPGVTYKVYRKAK